MRSLFLVLLLSSTSFAATEFQRLESAFKDSAVPEHKQLTGYWAGRCVDAADPDRASAAVFVHKLVDDPTAFPPKRPSFSYYTDAKLAPNYFDKLSPFQIEAYPPIKTYFQKEQWAKAEVSDGSLVTEFQPASGDKVHRAARLFYDEFNTLIVLRVSRGTAVQRYCHFAQSLGGQDGGTQPHPVGELIAKSGPIGNRWVVLQNPHPYTLLQSIWLDNAEGDITLQETTLLIAEGVSPAPRFIPLRPYASTKLKMLDGGPFRMTNIRFYVRGSTSNLTIRGITYRGEPWSGRLQLESVSGE